MLLDNNFSIKNQSSNYIGQDKHISSHRRLPENIVVATVSVGPEYVPVVVSTVRTHIFCEMVQATTASDPMLQKVLCFHSTNWPNVCDLSQLPNNSSKVDFPCLRVMEPFCSMNVVVVLLKMQTRILKQFHCAHQGIIHSAQLCLLDELGRCN